MSSIRLSIAALLCAVAVAPRGLPAAEQFVWFGTYTSGKSGSEGIYVARFDPETGALSEPVLAGVAKNPSFIALHPRLPVLYAVAEVATDGGTPGGGVLAFAIDEATGKLTPKNSRSSVGAGPCHVSVDPDGKVVLAANYGGGSSICLGIEPDGGLKPLVTGTPGGFVQHPYDRGDEPGINRGRQEKPHAHCIYATADGRYAITCDLGLDKVLIFALDRDRATLTPHAEVAIANGSGPRHFALHPNGRFGYSINELNMTATAYALDPQAGTLRELQTVSSLPADVTDRTGLSTAEIVVHPSGRFAYASNRGHHSIAMYAIDEATGRLTLLGVEPIRAKQPRNFVIAPGGKFLLVGGQDSGTVTVFAIDQATGRLTYTDRSVTVPSPVSIRFRP